MATLLWRTGAPKATLMPLSEPVEESSDGGQNETFSRIQRLNQLEGCGGIDGVGSPTRKLLKNQHIRRQGVAALARNESTPRPHRSGVTESHFQSKKGDRYEP